MDEGPYRSPPPRPRGAPCPRCRADGRLARTTIGTIELEECLTCGGHFLGVAAFQDLLLDLGAQEVIVARHAAVRVAERSVVYGACPRCGEVMLRRNFAGTSGIVLDACPAHGVWLDRGELRAIAQGLIDNAFRPAGERRPALASMAPPGGEDRAYPPSQGSVVLAAIEALVDLLTGR